MERKKHLFSFATKTKYIGKYQFSIWNCNINWCSVSIRDKWKMVTSDKIYDHTMCFFVWVCEWIFYKIYVTRYSISATYKSFDVSDDILYWTFAKCLLQTKWIRWIGWFFSIVPITFVLYANSNQSKWCVICLQF